MLRLRPSELTLTPDDVEDTFRRIALRQTSRARANLPILPPGQPGRPILRRGAERSTRDAITALGSIPILQPQQATFSSVDEDAAYTSSQEVTPSTGHANTETFDSPIRNREAGSLQPAASPHSPVSPTWSLPSPVSSPRRTMHLPFRFGRSRRASTTQTQPDAIVSVSRTPTRGHVRLRSTGTGSIGDASNNSTLSPSGGSAEGTPGLRGGGDRTNDIVRDAPPAPSPLHQMQRLSSPAQQQPSGDPTKSPASPGEVQPTLYLEGYFDHTPDSTKYRIRESDKNRFLGITPHSEPRRGSDRQPSVVRSSSSGAAPGSRLASQARLQSSQFSDDVFATLPAAEPPARQLARSSTVTRGQDYHSNSPDIFHTSGGSLQPERTIARSRHISSDASGASARFSYYGSLPSRDPSMEHDSSRPQLDGAVAPNGSRHFPRSATPPAGTNTAFRPTSGSSVYSSPSMVGSGPHGLSPLPSMPYTRNQGGQLVPSNFTDYHPGSCVNAATAVAQGLESPLGPYAQHYQQLLHTQHAHQASLAQRNFVQTRAEGFQTRRSSHGQGSRSHVPTQSSYDPRGTIPSQPQQPSLRSVQRSSEQLANSAGHVSQFIDRGGRGEQRSGENNPVVPMSSQDQIAHIGRVQAQRAAYERLHNPRRAMQVETNINSSRRSIPQTTVPHDRSNRPNRPPDMTHLLLPPLNQERSSSPFMAHQQQRPAQGQSQLGAPLGSPGAPHRVPYRPASQQYSSGIPQRAPTHSYRPAPGALYLNPTRDSPRTALALDQGSGTTSRRSRSPLVRARTHRRIPPEQRDQENDGAISLMRREEENVNARYGEEEQQLATMNETPPRIGRVERRMLE